MKERLTGAIILVALIVVLVPELLSGPIRSSARAHGPAPSAEEPPLRSYTIDLADEAHGGSGTLRPQPASSAAPVAPPPESAVPPPAATAPAEQGIPATTQPPTQAPQPAASPARSAPPPSPPPAAAAAAAASGPGYVVQLGSFANRSNADKLAQHVRALGFQVAVSRSTVGRHLYRVQVVPAHERAAAEQILSKLRAQVPNASVVPK